MTEHAVRTEVRLIYPWAAMAIGDMFRVDFKHYRKTRSAAYNHALRKGVKFRTFLTESHVVVERVA